MTDIKATPATDEQVASIKAGLAKAFHARSASDLAAQMVTMILLARIAADAETIKAKEQEVIAPMFEKTPLLLAIDIANLELATLRDQVRTLRATARAACDLALPYMQGSPIPRHRDVIRSLETLRALAATEPKG